MDREYGYLFANISVAVFTLVVNTWAGLIILRKERTRIHMLIVYDCVANILSSLHTGFFQVKTLHKMLKALIVSLLWKKLTKKIYGLVVLCRVLK